MGQTDVLGLFANVDIDSISTAINDVVSKLQRVGAVTEETSARLSKALDKIGDSADKDLSAKLSAAMNMLQQAVKEADASMSGTPEKLAAAKKEVEAVAKACTKLEAELAKLEQERNDTVVGSKRFNELNTAISGVEQQLEQNRQSMQAHTADIKDMEAAQSAAAKAVEQLQGIYDDFAAKLNNTSDAGQNVAETTTQATEAAHKHAEAIKAEAESLANMFDKVSTDKLNELNNKAQQMGEKLGGTAKQLADGVKVNTTFVNAHLKYVEKTQHTLQNALNEGNNDLAEWALNELKGAKQRIDEAVAYVHANVETIERIASNPIPKAADSSDNVRTKLRQTTQELAALTIQYREMSDAEQRSAKGVELKQHIEELIKQAGTLRDAMDDANTSIKATASDTAAFDAIAQGLNVVTSIAGATEGAVSMLGLSEEDLMEVQTKLQASLAISNALSTIQTNLQKESALMLGVRTVQEKALAAGVALRTAAEGKGIIATKAATVAQAAFNLVAKANPYVLLATAVITVVGALAAFAIGSKKATEAEKQQAEAAEKLKQKQEEMSNALGKTAGNVEAKYRSLQQQWARLRTEADKNKWVKDNANAFKELGLKVNSVSDAEQILVNMAPQVIAALKAVAAAEAYNDLYKQAIVKRATEWEHRVKSTATGDKYKPVRQGERISDEEYRAAGLAAGDVQYSTQYSPSAGISYTQNLGLNKSGVDKVNAYRREQAIKLRKELESGYNEEVDFYANKWEEAERAAAEAKKKIPQSLLDTGGNGGSGNGGSGNTAGVQLKSARELNDQLLTLKKERIDNEIALEQEGTARYMDLMRERIRIQAEIDTRAARQTGDEAIADLDASYKGGKSGLTSEQYNERRVLLEKNTRATIEAIEAKAQKDAATLEEARLQAVKERLQLEQTALLDYLQTYGDYEQRKLAITQEYEDRIAHAKTQGERMMLERQMEDALAGLDMEKFKESVNWEAIFNDLDKVSLEHLTKLKEQLKEMLNSNDVSAENAKVIAEQINRINEQIATKQKEWQSAFGLVIPELERVRLLKQEELEAQERLNKAQERQADALKEVAEARKKIVELAQKEGITVDSNSVTTQGQSGVFQLFQNAGKDTKQLSDLFSLLGQKENALAKSTQNLAGAQQAAGQAAQSAGSSFAGTVAIIDAIVHGINDNVQSAKELFDQMGIADTNFGKGFSSFAESSKYATEAWESLKSGNVMGVANGVYGSLRTLGDALGEWGISGFGSSDTSLQSDIERLTQSNKDLERAINNLADKMDDSSVVEATGIYEQQKQKLLESEQNTRELMQRSASAYSNGFLGIGGHHSSSAKINDSVSYSEWSRLSQLLGKSVRSADDFFNLTSEEMYKVATEATDIYSHIKDLANDGYKDAAQFMDSYLEYWQELQKLEEAYVQKLTSASFDSIENEFVNALLDMDSDAQAFADNFEKYMQQAIVNSLVSDKYKPLLEKWYKAFGAYMQDGMISEFERQLLLNGGTYYDNTTGKTESFQGWNSLTESALAERNTLRDTFNWGGNSYQQEGSKGAWQSLGEDTGQELNGRFTALQITGESILAQSIEQTATLMGVQQEISLSRTEIVSINNNVAEIRELTETANGLLSNIDKNTRPIAEMQETLQQMNQKLDKL